MTQRHFEQQGIFHVTTNAKGNIPWLTWEGIPQILIDNLWMTRNVHVAEIYAFCVLPDHMHVVMKPGEKGLSRFMHSFKRNSSWQIRMMRRKANPFFVAEVHEPPLQKMDLPMSPLWQKGFHDEKIETDDQRENALAYVRCNAWRHGLVDDPKDWAWSSMHFPAFVDPVEIW